MVPVSGAGFTRNAAGADHGLNVLLERKLGAADAQQGTPISPRCVLVSVTVPSPSMIPATYAASLTYI